MAHPRKSIRLAVVALLIAAATAAEGRVNPTRVEPNKKSELPALGVYTLSDVVDAAASDAQDEVHRLELEVVGWVAHADSNPSDNQMDDIAEQVELAMSGDLFLGGLLSEELQFVGTTMEVVEDDGRSDPLVGVVVFTYSATYRRAKAVAVATDDFLRADVKQTPVGGVGDTAPAEDLINVRSTP